MSSLIFFFFFSFYPLSGVEEDEEQARLRMLAPTQIRQAFTAAPPLVPETACPSCVFYDLGRLCYSGDLHIPPLPPAGTERVVGWGGEDRKGRGIRIPECFNSKLNKNKNKSHENPQPYFRGSE